MTAARVLTVPGWHGSGPGHWQTLWEQRFGYQRVEQHDWTRPLRGDWSARLEDEILAGQGAPTLLVAHSLGCALVAAWAGHSRNARLVRGALLVAPPDLQRVDLREQLPGWAPPTVAQPLPFLSTVLASSDDPYGSLASARAFASERKAAFVDLGPHGHLNAEAGLGDWPQGQAYLRELAGAAGLALPPPRPTAAY